MNYSGLIKCELWDERKQPGAFNKKLDSLQFFFPAGIKSHKTNADLTQHILVIVSHYKMLKFQKKKNAGRAKRKTRLDPTSILSLNLRRCESCCLCNCIFFVFLFFYWPPVTTYGLSSLNKCDATIKLQIKTKRKKASFSFTFGSLIHIPLIE